MQVNTTGNQACVQLGDKDTLPFDRVHSPWGLGLISMLLAKCFPRGQAEDKVFRPTGWNYNWLRKQDLLKYKAMSSCFFSYCIEISYNDKWLIHIRKGRSPDHCDVGQKVLKPTSDHFWTYFMSKVNLSIEIVLKSTFLFCRYTATTKVT